MAPSFGFSVPPGGAPALLGFLRANGCEDFGFIDFRNWFPVGVPTFDPVGTFCETFVLDVPELPIILATLRRFRESKLPLLPPRDDLFDDYCMGRNLDPARVHAYLSALESFFAQTWQNMRGVRFVGFTTWTTNYLATLLAAGQLKRAERDVFIVAGGPQVSESRNAARLGLRAGVFDSVVVGEGEQALLELYQGFLEARLPAPIARVMWPDRQAVSVDGPGAARSCEAAPRRTLLSLADLPVPSFEELELADYRGWRHSKMLPYQLSRGCTDKCSFCSEWVFWERFRASTAQHAVAQIGELSRRYGARHISFTDSLLNGDAVHLTGFCEGLLAAGLDVTWSGFMRAQVDREMARLLRRAGCTSVFLGIESMADETLELMNKQRTAADNANAIEVFIRHGIKVEVGLIPGFPGDTRERFLNTVNALHALQRKYPGALLVGCEPFRPTPRQPIYARMERYGLQTQPWSEAVVDIDPFLADLAAGIHCTVTGSNQGVERGGEGDYAALRTARHNAAVTMGPHWGPVQLTELSPGDTRIGHVKGRWFRIIRMSETGLCSFMLASQQEVDALVPDRLTGEHAPARDVAVRSGRVNEALWDRIALQHLVVGRLAPDDIVIATDSRSGRLSPSPRWAARVVTDPAEEQGLWLLNFGDDEILNVDSCAQGVILESRDGRSFDDLKASLAAASGASGDEAAAFLGSLVERGFFRQAVH